MELVVVSVSLRSELSSMTGYLYHTFEEDVRDEEQRESNVVLYAIHAQVFNHAFDLCVADVGSVDVSLCVRTLCVSQGFGVILNNPIPTHHEVQQCQDRHKTDVDLSNHFLLHSLYRAFVLVESMKVVVPTKLQL